MNNMRPNLCKSHLFLVWEEFRLKRIGLCISSVLLITALALTGCSASTTTDSTSGKTETANRPEPVAAAQVAAPVKEVITAKIGGTDRDSLKHLPLFLSSFGKEDAVQASFTEYQGGSALAKALLDKTIDFGVLQVEHVLRDTSGEMQIVALITRNPGLVLLVDSRYKEEIKSVQDLAGKRVGISGIGGASHQFLLTLAQQSKLDPNSMTMLPLGLNAVDVLAKDEVHATVSLEPFVTQVIEIGRAHV